MKSGCVKITSYFLIIFCILELAIQIQGQRYSYSTGNGDEVDDYSSPKKKIGEGDEEVIPPPIRGYLKSPSPPPPKKGCLGKCIWTCGVRNLSMSAFCVPTCVGYCRTHNNVWNAGDFAHSPPRYVQNSC